MSQRLGNKLIQAIAACHRLQSDLPVDLRGRDERWARCSLSGRRQRGGWVAFNSLAAVAIQALGSVGTIALTATGPGLTDIN